MSDWSTPIECAKCGSKDTRFVEPPFEMPDIFIRDNEMNMTPIALNTSFFNTQRMVQE